MGGGERDMTICMWGERQAEEGERRKRKQRMILTKNK